VLEKLLRADCAGQLALADRFLVAGDKLIFQFCPQLRFH